MRRAQETCRIAGHGDVAEARDERVLAEVRAVEGDVLLFAHGHVLGVLAARRLGLPPSDGGLFSLDTATLSVLGYEHDGPAILRWDAPL